MLGLATSNEDLLCLIIRQISTPMKRSPSTPPTTPPTIGPTSVFRGAETGAYEVLDGEPEGLAVVEVVEEDPNGGPMSSPLTAIFCASVLLNFLLVQILGSS